MQTRVRSRRADVAVAVVGETLRLRADGVRGPDGVVVGVAEADADSIVAHTHRQSTRR